MTRDVTVELKALRLHGMAGAWADLVEQGTNAGLDAVLVAVELALETGPPGKVSVEHVVNVLGRLNAQPAPPTAATHLKATTPPLADTARYDTLRGDTRTDSGADDTIGAATEGASHEA